MLHGFHARFYYVTVGREEARLLRFGESPFFDQCFPRVADHVK
jgi:hypothetical protein